MAASDSIAGLGSKDDHVAPTPGADALRLGLTPDEAALFAKVGKVTKIRDLLARSGHQEAAAIALLLALRAKGAVVPARVAPPSAPSTVDAAALEDIELDPERKAEILQRERLLEVQNHYEILGLEVGAGAEQVKEAYYELSRRFHPDRFYSKNLGSFRARVDRIFRRIKEAHGVLIDDGKRKAYLKAHPSLVAKAPRAPTPPPRTAVDDARDAERRARLARHPYLAKTMKATSLLARGRAAMETGAYADAYANLHKANQIRPESSDVPELLDESRKKHEQSRAREQLQAGNQARVAGKFDLALHAFKMALSLDPGLSTAAWRAAEILVQKGDAPEEAQQLAEQAVKIEPRRADHHVTLGQALLARDSKEARKAAKEHFEEALRLDPEHEEAKKGLKKTRWLF